MKTWYELKTIAVENDEISKPTGDYLLEEGPWWAFALSETIHYLCDVIMKVTNRIPLPKSLRYYCKDDDEYYTWKEWYRTWGGIFHIYICDPVWHWSYKKIKLTYTTLKKKSDQSGPKKN